MAANVVPNRRGGPADADRALRAGLEGYIGFLRRLASAARSWGDLSGDLVADRSEVVAGDLALILLGKASEVDASFFDPATNAIVAVDILAAPDASG